MSLSAENLPMVIPWRSRIDQLARRYLGRPVIHLTPQYILDRSRVWAYQRRHPDAPWLTHDAISILSSALRKSDNGLEYGSGRSTLWFAQRTHSLISVETSGVWVDRVDQMIAEQGLKNIKYIHIPTDPQIADDPYRAPYTRVDDSIAMESLDYVLVDGVYRDECALRAVELLKPGGILILDNANWFLPYETSSPFSVAIPKSLLWTDFLSRVAA